MKSAYVTPILKKADLDSSDAKLYRPISNLSVLSKSRNDSCLNSLWRISEKTTYCQIINQLTEHII